jgi:hypothetical protein
MVCPATTLVSENGGRRGGAARDEQPDTAGVWPEPGQASNPSAVLGVEAGELGPALAAMRAMPVVLNSKNIVPMATPP